MEEPEQKLRPTCRKRGPWETPIQKGTQGQGPPSSEPPFSGWEIKTEITDQDTPVPVPEGTGSWTKKGNSNKGWVVCYSDFIAGEEGKVGKLPWNTLAQSPSNGVWCILLLAFRWHCVSLQPSPVDAKGSMSHRLPSALPSALDHGPCLLHIAKKSFIHVAWSLPYPSDF